jgi:predicted DNA-binding transcriptional regulator AlpA
MFDFILKFALPNPDDDPAAHIDALFEAGCDDATMGVGKRGVIALDFSRDGNDAEAAVRSAIADVQRAVPGARLVEIKPDLVNLADVAHILGCSRQNIRKYVSGEMKSVKAHFPEPVLSSATSFWHLYEVLSWMGCNTELKASEALVDLSRVAATTNLQLRMGRIGGYPGRDSAK